MKNLVVVSLKLKPDQLFQSRVGRRTGDGQSWASPSEAQLQGLAWEGVSLSGAESEARRRTWSSGNTLRYGFEVLWVACVYFIVGGLGMYFGQPAANLVLPPAGIAIAAPFLFGFRIWPGLFIGALALGFRTHGDPAGIWVIAIGNTVEGLVGAWLIERFAGGRHFYKRPADIVKFALLGGLLSPLLSPPFGLLNSSVKNFAFWRLASGTQLAWLLGEMVSVLVLVPLLLLWSESPQRRLKPEQRLEFGVLLLILIVLSAGIFTDLPPAWARGYLLPYLSLPFPIWAAHRFGPRATALTSFIQCVMALGGTLGGHGPFGIEPSAQALCAYQGFSSFSAVVGLIVAAAVGQRRLAQEALELANGELDRRVVQRTLQLENEIERRRAVELDLAADVEERKLAQAALSQARDELELRVKARTLELSQANESLEKENRQRRLAETELARTLQRVIDVQESERCRISRELHDEFGQNLNALKLGLKMAGSGGQESAWKSMDLPKLVELADHLLQSVHRLAWELRPPVLDDLGLAQALKRYSEDWSARSGIAIRFQDIAMHSRRLPAKIKTTCYRVTQEALANVLKHSGADSVSLILDHQPDNILLILEDNGRGFSVSESRQIPGPSGGMGLLGMRERVSFVGGTFEVESAPGAGTTVYVRIPIHEESDFSKDIS